MKCYPFDPIEDLMLFIDDQGLSKNSNSNIRSRLKATGHYLTIFARIAQNKVVIGDSLTHYITRAKEAVRIYRSTEFQEEYDLEWMWADAVAFAHYGDLCFDGSDYEKILYPQIVAHANEFETMRSLGEPTTFGYDF